jgi:tripartite-type tricarboxylate transporter receptor subunit TctC
MGRITIMDEHVVPARRRRALVGALALVFSSLALPGLAAAQASYPDRPIKLVIPFAPGGVYDAVGRPWAEKMGLTLGTFVIENRGGGGGSVGAASVATAPPDGYTLLLGGAGPNVVSPLSAAGKIYDPVKAFAPIALLAKGPFGIIVHPGVPATSLAELIAHAKNQPGRLAYATAGVGSGNHLAGELFKSLAGLPDISHVPYKGAGPALTDVLGGHVPIGTPSINAQILELHRAGKVRVLAVTGPKRLSTAPDVPTAEESLPGMLAENFLMLFAPIGTPQAIIDRIHAASQQAVALEDLQKTFAAGGLETVRDSDPESAARFLAGELARWAPLIETAGLKR